MIQRRISALLTIVLFLAAGCDRATPQAPTSRHAAARVVSLSPAATDLIAAMGLHDRLVAVSNFEPPRESTDDLPRVGDYRTADWEKIAQLKPDLIITQYRDDKMPDGFADRAAQLGIRVFNRKIDSLDDIEAAIVEMGDEFQARDNATATIDRWKRTMDKVRAAAAGKSRKRVLLIVGESGLAAVGPKTFLSDVLNIAGGENVLTDGVDYPTLDRERLAQLNPDIIIQLLPAASPQMIEQARSFWPTMPNLAAVKSNQIQVMTEPDVLLPGFGVTRTAERFSTILHHPTTRPN
jgi:iron complex transport system substrate-binding protein